MLAMWFDHLNNELFYQILNNAAIAELTTQRPMGHNAHLSEQL